MSPNPITTTDSAKAWSPDLQTFAAQDVIPEALVLQTSTVAGSIEGDEPAVRVAYVDDADAQFTAEGADIPEAEPTLSEVLVHTGKVTLLVRVSREQYVQNGTADILSDSARRAVLKKANEAYLSQVIPTPPAVTPPGGVLTHPGIQDGGQIATNLDALADAFTLVEIAGGNVTHLLAAPDTWGALRKLKKGSSSNESLLGAGTDDAEKRILNTPVFTSNAVPSGTLALLDKSAIVSAAGAVQVATSEHAYFGSDSIALRVTFRFGQNLVRPKRIAKLSLKLS
ncbi:phage major capsid protein [Curtobacterium aetherium]|uniref:Phage major capsid protein n=1 Tax=Curtobacterium aetherium TaxID=2841594 RepID=A0ACD1E551_9MICO|nr:phage major capsid protein [Curtobacterium sp. L6-1]QWS34045.1 phage major capsid protein [Curtobacterium sp. L6-1]